MSLDKNIENAFEVVRKTYENVEKMMSFIDEKSIEYGYEPVISRFLRYRSDMSIWGWMCNELIKIYQSEEDSMLPSEWKDGLIYTVSFDFYGEPKVVVSAFNFDIEKWGKGISPADIWAFSEPLDIDYEERFIHTKMEDNDFWIVKPVNEETTQRYWEFNYAIYREYKISEMTSDNINEKIFREFEKMKFIKGQ